MFFTIFIYFYFISVVIFIVTLILLLFYGRLPMIFGRKQWKIIKECLMLDDFELESDYNSGSVVTKIYVSPSTRYKVYTFDYRNGEKECCVFLGNNCVVSDFWKHHTQKLMKKVEKKNR